MSANVIIGSTASASVMALKKLKNLIIISTNREQVSN
jgi:hypothetical protein